eukprot:CAMPEP_0206469412 /NCGR_PEP_ID=MMETSP0324_2-20121206/30263_1 /ASSEMBLY_ACC=CAM_ASM_000836 /TAXON_ID=2866 /ORGANISM="Crypthecodinium cohnii, Strain Seligo" /LENGTH=525 /DNA_ID=CAMNT_0053943163 /DNA_START=37 /DNA_END=1614 /DNA_ORIENTATION=+
MAAVPAPFTWPEFKGPSSRVVKAPKTWQDEAILIPHECIRWWDKELREVLKTFDATPGNEWKIEALFTYIVDYFASCVHHHHDSEEKIYNPWIEAIIKRPVDKSIKPEHAELMKLLDHVATFKGKILSAPQSEKNTQVEEFKKSMEELFVLLENHLECEEKSYPEALYEAKVTEEEDGAKVGEVLMSMGMDGNMRFLPVVIYTMCEWKGPKEAFEFLATKVPPPVQEEFKKSWLKDFHENQLQVLAALKTDTPPPVPNALAAPFAWPQFKGPSSRVIKAPKTWQDEAILIPHECIRWWDQELREVLKTYDAAPGTEWKTKALFKYITEYYTACVHHHHDSEEKIYNPWIEAIIKRPVDKSIKPEHQELMKMLDLVASFKSKILSAPQAQKEVHVKEFKKTMEDLFELLENHLECEERSYPEALYEAKVSEEEDGAKVGEIFVSLGVDGNMRFLPVVIYTMCEWKGPKAAFEFLATKVPPPAQEELKKSWLQDFHNNQLKVLHALKTDEPLFEVQPGCQPVCCSVM